MLVVKSDNFQLITPVYFLLYRMIKQINDSMTLTRSVVTSDNFQMTIFAGLLRVKLPYLGTVGYLLAIFLITSRTLEWVI